MFSKIFLKQKKQRRRKNHVMIDKRSEGREVTVSREGMEEAQKT
jgi:hypothetical protein